MIYLLEDDDSIRKLVSYALESQGYETKGFSHPEDFWAEMRHALPQLVLLDIMLPQEDGLSILSKLRENKETSRLPVIMLTAKNSEYDRAFGLDLGADDYVSKPFGMMEMVARVRAVLRRTADSMGEQEYRMGELTVNPARHQVTVNGAPVQLTFKEFMLLELLLEANGSVLTRSVLMDKVWGLAAERENRTLDVHIRTLRAKLGSAGKYVETVRGVGYRMNGEAL
ncbi:MAG: response regulator transcription factor [Oscillospiraceae bacterium]|nr:response regulator transcription factor [Oscillospiraceae bacterium]